MLVSHDHFRATGEVEEPEGARGPRRVQAETRPLTEVPGEQWDRLADRASEPNPFSERWMMLAAARHLGPGGETRAIAVWDGEEPGRELIGLIPVVIERGYAHLPIAFVRNWRHHHNFLGTPLTAAGRECDFWSAVLIHLDESPWAKGFFHLDNVVEDGPVHRGLAEASAKLGRPCAVVHRLQRAILQSGLSPQAYYEAAVRKKKRKELKRLSARLAERGGVAYERLDARGDAERWCSDFLTLEASGWKGRSGSALATDPATEAFFREIFMGAHSAGRLEALRLTLDGKPIAMLVNFLTPPGSFSFKIAIDEDFAAFSPGVLIQIENLKLLGRADVDWMDSCAAEDHSMINSLWRERRSVVRLSVPLSGRSRRAIFLAVRMVERLSALARRRAGRSSIADPNSLGADE